MEARQDFLRSHAGGLTLAPDAEEVGLLDVLFAVEDGGHNSHANRG